MVGDFTRFLVQLLAVMRFAWAVLVVLVVMLLPCAVIIRAAEGMSDGQVVFLFMMIGLAIGYGDITPTTAMGQPCSVLAGVIGLLFNGIVVAVAVRAMSDAIHEGFDDQHPGRSVAAATP